MLDSSHPLRTQFCLLIPDSKLSPTTKCDMLTDTLNRWTQCNSRHDRTIKVIGRSLDKETRARGQCSEENQRTPTGNRTCG